MKTTERGFNIYGSINDSYGSTVRVQESSTVGEERCWIFTDNDPAVYKEPSPHLTANQAEQLIEILQDFIDHARSEDNWRNEAEYRNFSDDLPQMMAGIAEELKR